MPIAAGGLSLVIILVVVVIFVGVAASYYQRGRSDISDHPFGDEGSDAPGAAGPSRTSSVDDETEGVPDTHGTR